MNRSGWFCIPWLQPQSEPGLAQPYIKSLGNQQNPKWTLGHLCIPIFAFKSPRLNWIISFSLRKSFLVHYYRHPACMDTGAIQHVWVPVYLAEDS